MTIRQRKWLTTIEPIKKQGHTLRYRESSWSVIPRREFRTFLVRLTIRERKSAPGPTRSYWRRKRMNAVRFYEGKWGLVPAVLHERKLPDPGVMYKAEGWMEWAKA